MMHIISLFIRCIVVLNLCILIGYTSEKWLCHVVAHITVYFTELVGYTLKTLRCPCCPLSDHKQ